MSWRATSASSWRCASSLEGTGTESTGLIAARARRTILKSMAFEALRVDQALRSACV